MTKPSSNTKAPSVLIIDDNSNDLKLLCALFEKSGAEVTASSGGVKAVEVAKDRTLAEDPFSLIILDIHMPEMNGFQVAEAIRKSGYKGPIIAFTAVATSKWKKESQQAGIEAYFNKTTLKVELTKAILHQYCGW